LPRSPPWQEYEVVTATLPIFRLLSRVARSLVYPRLPLVRRGLVQFLDIRERRKVMVPFAFVDSGRVIAKASAPWKSKTTSPLWIRTVSLLPCAPTTSQRAGEASSLGTQKFMLIPSP